MDGTTTTPAEYEMACARFSVISENHDALMALITTMAAAVEAEFQSAEAELHAHERRAGLHKPYAPGARDLTISEINQLRDAAVPRLAELLPWASQVIK